MLQQVVGGAMILVRQLREHLLTEISPEILNLPSIILYITPCTIGISQGRVQKT